MAVNDGWIARSLYGCVCPDCGGHCETFPSTPDFAAVIRTLGGQTHVQAHRFPCPQVNWTTP